ncbi:biotin/lipoyl-containing protein [Nocardia sp. NPDC059240]|uniref:biotin/lipoyl-containing protein n=1 Tax=Nocardia sp. NPDC059240 TaxID=3346786 RepID=UPI00367B92B4
MNELPRTAAARIAQELNLVLDIKHHRLSAVRDEFLQMTHTAWVRTGESQHQIAKRSGLAVATVNNFAAGPRPRDPAKTNYDSWPRPDTLRKYLRACEFTPEQVDFVLDRLKKLKKQFPNARKILASADPVSWRDGLVAREIRLWVPSPGELAFREAVRLQPAPWQQDCWMVMLAYSLVGIEMLDRAAPAAAGVPVPVEATRLRVGDIIIDRAGATLGLYKGVGLVLTGTRGAIRLSALSATAVARRLPGWPAEPVPTQPGLQALTVTDNLPRGRFPGQQTDFVAAAFRAAGVELPDNAFTTTTLRAYPLERSQHRRGDIVVTVDGDIGLYAGDNKLLYVGADGRATTLTLRHHHIVATRRAVLRPGSTPRCAVIDIAGTGTGFYMVPRLRQNTEESHIAGIADAVSNPQALDHRPPPDPGDSAPVQLPPATTTDHFVAAALTLVSPEALRDAVRTYMADITGDADPVAAIIAQIDDHATHQPVPDFAPTTLEQHVVAGNEVTAPEMFDEQVGDGQVLHWHKTIGDVVDVGEPLLHLAAPTFAFDMPSPVGGTMRAIIAPVGSIVQANMVLCVIA